MAYKNWLIIKDTRKGYITSNRYLIFDEHFSFWGANDTVKLAKWAIDVKIKMRKEEQ